MKKALLLLALLPIATIPALAAPVTYTMDPAHTQIVFSYSHMGFSHITGRFDSSEGTVIYDAENPAASSVEITTRISSITTGSEALDEHLLNEDFFESETFPTASFKSTKVEATGENRLAVTGDLTIHGVTLPTTFEVTINKVGDHPMTRAPAAGFDARGTIDRAAFGVDYYTMVTGPNVELRITTEAHAPKPDADD